MKMEKGRERGLEGRKEGKGGVGKRIKRRMG